MYPTVTDVAHKDGKIKYTENFVEVLNKKMFPEKLGLFFFLNQWRKYAAPFQITFSKGIHEYLVRAFS